MTLTVLVPDDEGLQLLGGLPGLRPVRYRPGAAWPADGLDAEVIVVRSDSGDAVRAALPGLPALRLVQTLSAGVERWRGRLPAGVGLSNARGAGGLAVAELVLAGLLAFARGLPGFLRAQDQERWEYRVTPSLIGARVLVIGAGDIGLSLRSLLVPLRAHTVLAGRTRRSGVVSLADARSLLPAQDAVVLAVPLDPSTHHLADAAFLAALRDGAVLVNAGRGPLVDTDALVAELSAGRLRAALDVTDPEPLPPGHPLWTCPGLLLTPHVGTATSGESARQWAVAAEQIATYRDGGPPANLVTD